MKSKFLTGLLVSLSMWVSWSPSSSDALQHQTSQQIFDNFVDHNDNLPMQNPILDTNIDEMSLSDIQSSMLSYINTIRTKKWLKKLSLLENNVAQNHSSYLFSEKQDLSLSYEDHFGANWESVLDRVREAQIPIDENFEKKKAGENIASSHMTVRAIVDAWLQSPTHAENLLCKDFDAICVWHADNSNNIVVVFVNLK